MNEHMQRVRVVVTGRIQGVWFRAFTCDRATAVGVVGWVRNLPDGRVEMVAEGDRASLNTLLADVRQGPPLARVDHVEVVWSDPCGEHGFVIRRP